MAADKVNVVDVVMGFQIQQGHSYSTFVSFDLPGTFTLQLVAIENQYAKSLNKRKNKSITSVLINFYLENIKVFGGKVYLLMLAVPDTVFKRMSSHVT